MSNYKSAGVNGIQFGRRNFSQSMEIMYADWNAMMPNQVPIRRSGVLRMAHDVFNIHAHHARTHDQDEGNTNISLETLDQHRGENVAGFVKDFLFQTGHMQGLVH